ncbi:hypothetical protein AALO_G00029570 [Alosa alosa]|uniref:protein-serine/threonine phosphatase n=1 Tax=Alosa alosa TaxID=278164 RepID=A0AAV6HBM8_9TELE|nr:hypothetical protein AALO_G00029570 [Alosa alosa]
MTQGGVAAEACSSVGCLCVCYGGKHMPYFKKNAVVSQTQLYQFISESFLTVKGAALFLPRGNGSPSSSRVPHQRSKHAGDLQQHLQNMFTLLRPEDNIKLAVRLESFHAQCTRYMVVVSTNGRQDTEESVVLGMDFSPTDGSCSIGMVLPLWSDTLIHLDGDGGFSVSTDNKIHVFKPVSVQAMWSALQSLHKACEVARGHNYFPGSLFLTWVSYYQSRVASDQARINEWNAMQDVQSTRPDSPLLFSDVPTERERTERLIKTRLREIMMQKDLENVTSKEIRTELEMQMTCNLREFKEYIDNEMIVILGQMDSPTAIFDHVFLGSEWNASNLEELQNSGVQYILNVTREIDNFFPGLFEYHNIRVYDEEATDLLAYWNDTYKFISRAKKNGAKCLVHCKMGVSRSAATVIAYAMKEYGWDLERAFDYVKERRTVTKPNPSFMRQLEEYQGILLARELEQRLRQELEVPVAPVPAAAPHSPPRRSPVPKDKAEDNPPGQDSEQKPVTAQPILPQTPDAMEKLDGGMMEGNVKKDDGKTAGVPQGAQELDSGGTKEASTISSSAPDHHTEERPDGTSTTPSTDGLSTKPDHTSASAVSVIRLEGVTEQDSGTDKDGLFGPRTEADLLEAWETLKELGAFLRQVRSALASDLGPSSWLPGRRGKRDPRERSRQAGARIRQAGLTTPSLMKRSASLAKLGSLELTANDLGDWDLDAAGLSPAHWRLGTAPTDDASKKKRVRPQHDPSSNPPPSSSSPSSHPQTHTEDPLRKEEARHHDDATVPLSDTAPHPSAHGRSDMPQNSGLTPQSVPDLISVATRQQYGRTHPLRRLKKRTVSFLYHTV